MPIIDPKKQKIIVELDEGEGEGRAARQRRLETLNPNLGMLPAYLGSPRILRRRKSLAGLIDIYDGGYYETGGVFNNLPFRQTAAPNASGRSAWEAAYLAGEPLPEYPYLADTVSYADYISLLNMITPVMDALKNTSALIEEFRVLYQSEEEYFPFMAYISGDTFEYWIIDSLRPPEHPAYNEKWKTGGLTLTPGELSQGITVATEYNFFKISGLGKNHITILPDYGAAAAEFIPSGKMKIIAIPPLQAFQAFSYWTTLPPEATPNFAWSPVTRFSPLRSMAYDTESPYFRSYAGGFWGRFGGGEDVYRAAYTGLQTAAAHALPIGGVLANSSIFPPPPFGDPYEFNPDGLALSFLGTERSFMVEHVIVALIRQATRLFYVWS